jgi:hypothetical protein
MIRLDTVNRSLTLVLGGAQVTAPLQIVVSYSDQTSASYLGSTQLTNSNGATAVTICSAPAASVIRDIDMVTVLNTDTASQIVTIQLLNTATTYKIISVTLLVGDKLTYTHGSAWQVVNNSGNIKYSVLSSSGVDSFSGGSTGLTPATATTGAVTLGGTLAVASGGTGTATPALVAGTNVTINGTWPNQTINSSNTGGTVTSVAALTLGTTGTDVSSTVANSTTTPVITLNLPTASATNRGALSAADWSTFNSKGTGTVTSVTGTAPVVSSGGTTPAISMAAANTTTDGYLTSTDWNTFNGKGTGTVTSVSGTTGRITSTGGTTPVLDLTSGIATPGTTGSATLVPVVTIDTYGRVTSITTAANPQGTVTSVTGTAPVVSSGGATPAISMAAATTSVSGYLTSTDWTTFNNKGSGSVTSVAATVPTFLSVTGSPITTSGTLAISYSGTALPIANGGSGQTTAQAAMNAFAGAVTSGSYLRGNGTNVVMSTIQAADVPTLNQNTTGTATTATNIAGGANLQIPYNTGSGATSFIAAPTIGSTYLQYTGTGFAWAAAAGLGTVTSVAATVPAFLSITGSPITTAGTLAISYSGTALPVANGGTGVTTSTGTTNVVLSNSPTLVTPTINTITSAASTALTLQSAGTTAVTVDTSQNVGIGTTSPGAKLDVTGSIRASVNVTSAADFIGGGASGYAALYADGAGGLVICRGSSSTNDVEFYTGSTERMRIDSSGSVLINTTTNPGGGAKLGIKGAGTTNGTVSLYMINSASTALVLVYDDGGFYSGLAANSPFNNTTATGANAVFAANGFMQRSTSSLKYKKDVQDATHGLTDLLKLRSVTYKGKSECDGETIFGGLIAEEVDAAGLKEFVQYAEDGSPDALSYGNMVSLCVKAIQELTAKVTALEAQVGASA